MIRQILEPLHTLFAQQLLNFLFYGYLFDPYSEFFLKARPPSPFTTPTTASAARSPIGEEPELDEFHVNAALLPNFLNEKIISKIQFVGEARAVLQQRFKHLPPSLKRMLHDYSSIHGTGDYRSPL